MQAYRPIMAKDRRSRGRKMLHGDVLRPLPRMKTEPNQLLRFLEVIAEKARRLHSIHYVYLTLERVTPTSVCLPTALERREIKRNRPFPLQA
ncbi:hypothetical protein BS628_21475 [Agrobacterium radiobacter]|uniref:Transposase n=3 Tax=Agrobacterium tumefaciens complex TaxID=1183400 RepID=A0A1S7RE50_AGRTU|nr:hypothetical protein L902_09800 [Agrobacterium radiobacter DSM 30147]KWT76565.1 hypothetical protein ASH09_14160 [Agrobacterium radiobacter]MQB38932.1 hypothetical protein [Agrobacterium tumefaciens]TGE78412.1 hypothetical protein C9410_16800 [Rhizobium sp. SEMIA 439]CUX50647.1 hypothetical protein AGR4C_Lc130082 [Agrobacterium tumefaciens str. Kerr 14]